MFNKKILMISASALFAIATTTARADVVSTNPPPVLAPLYDVSPLSATIKVVGSELVIPQNENGGSKIFKDTAAAKVLIRLIMGGNAKTPIPGEKNYVLGLANLKNDDGCTAEIVIWNKNKANPGVVAEVATVSNCSDYSPVYSGPASNKNGTRQEYFTLKVSFIGQETTCGYLDTSFISGEGLALGQYAEKQVNKTQPPSSAPVSLTIVHLAGDLLASDGDESTHLVITDGSFKANLAQKALLGSSAVQIKLTGCSTQQAPIQTAPVS